MNAAQEFHRRLMEALENEDWEIAERLLRRAAAQKSVPAAVFYNLAQVLVQAGRPDEAGEWYEKAVETDSSHADAWSEYADWLAERGAFDEALGAYEKAVSLLPEDLEVMFGAAQCATRLCAWEKASSLWSALAQAGDKRAAVGMLHVALEQGSPTAKELRRKLARAPHLRPELLKTLTKTARGSMPLRPRDL